MSLRRQLLLLSLALLMLPVAAWQVALQIEGFLREARQEALVSSARALARAFVATEVLNELALPADGLYVNAIGFALRVDGYADDWDLWRSWEQVFETGGGLRMLTLLAADPRRLYALIRVNDASPPRASASPAGFSDGDHVLLRLVDERGLHSYRIVPSVPGALEVVPAGPAGSLPPPPLEGAWRERDGGRGYLLEFSLPRSLVGSAVALAAVDAGDGLRPARIAGTGADGRIEPRRLMFRSPAWSTRLAELTPPGSRTWLVNAGGWVMASAGRLDGPFAASEPRGWQGLAYRLLARRTLEAGDDRDPSTDLRIGGGEVETALGGELGVRWRAAAGNTVLASVAVPVIADGRPVGALVVEQTGDALLLATNRTAGRVLGLTVGVVVLVVAALLAYASLLSWRVRRLRNAAESALDGDAPLNVTLPGGRSGDEIGDLSRSFSRLLTELKSYNDYLKTLAGKLSHELSTPLAVVRSSLENLAHEPLPDEAERYALRARDGAERLQRILRAMSEAQRLEQAIESADRVEFDLVEVVSGCLQGYRQLDSEHGWRLEREADALPLRGSPELIAQLLDKLIDNARSFAPLGSEIVIAVGPARRGARLNVSNDGPPLPDELRHRLFESLVSTREKTGDQVHLGLGLHIVRLIARAHRGTVKAANRADGSGVEFTVVLRGM